MKKHSATLIKFWPVLLALVLVALTALAEVTLPAGLTVIEAEAFLNDAGLTGRLVIPGGVTSIGRSAFEGTGITGLVIPESVEAINSRAFANCSGLTGTVFVPETVIYLAEDAFDGTDVEIIYGLEEDVTTDTDIPSTGTDIPGTGTDLPGTGTDLPGTGDVVITMTDLPVGYVYEVTTSGCVITGYNGQADAVLNIPGAIDGLPVVGIGDYAFQDCFELTGSVVLPATVTRVGSGAFFGCSGLDGVLVIPSSVTSIGDFAFFECVSLTGSLAIPSSVESVGESAFAFCESMTGSLSLPADVTLGARCFQGSGFTGSITIPATMTLGANVFAGTCLDITWEAPAFTYEQVSTIVTITGYNGPTGNGLTIPSRLGTGLVTGIAGEAFADAGLGGQLVIPASVVYIGDSAFRSNPGITSISFSKGLASISAYAFADCTGLSGTITLPNTVTSLHETAFSGCDVTVEIAPPDEP